MPNNELNSISFDYYNNMPSYVKYGLNLLPENEELEVKKDIIKDIYNFILSMYSREKLEEICTLSMLFESRINKLSIDEKTRISSLLFNHLNKMIYDFYGREELFDEMNESVKMFTGYYGIFGKYDEFSEKAQFSGNLFIKK